MENFSHNLYWIPGNGKKIIIWDDLILGEQPLNHVEGLENIRIWLQSNNLNTLWDISTWTDDTGRRWDSWYLGEIPQRLQVEASLLLDKLQGKSPTKETTKDKRGWGSLTGNFSVSEGYKSMTAIPNVPPDPTQWRFIWGFPSLPKIDFFCWTLAHNSILTRDILRKCGMEGPSRCPLCVSKEESDNHLFFLFPFARDVWRGSWGQGLTKLSFLVIFQTCFTTGPIYLHSVSLKNASSRQPGYGSLNSPAGSCGWRGTTGCLGMKNVLLEKLSLKSKLYWERLLIPNLQ